LKPGGMTAPRKGVADLHGNLILAVHISSRAAVSEPWSFPHLVTRGGGPDLAMGVTPADRQEATAIRRNGEIARRIERGESESESERAEQRWV
jgi:hypothetical protein